jgi:hypothetical protein
VRDIANAAKLLVVLWKIKKCPSIFLHQKVRGVTGLFQCIAVLCCRGMTLAANGIPLPEDQTPD